MAESVVSFVVGRLGDLLIEEAKLLGGARQQVKQMQIELKRMQCFLKDADTRQDQDESVRNWVSEIRDVAYDVEDVVETYALKAPSRENGNKFERFTSIFKKGTGLHKVGSKIEAIKISISDLTRSLQTYGVHAVREEGSSLAASARQVQLRWSYSHVVEDQIVGLEENIKELVAQLLKEEEQSCRVVSICGMGGLGKTTLAKKVHNHSDIRRHFDGFAWSYISQQCKKRDVWEGMLLKLTSPSKEERDEILKMRDEELAKKLYKVQIEKKCLVILDDIWSTEAWNSLSPAFPSAQTRSKILLTTRNREVAVHADPRSFVHEPGCLNEEKSWELFLKKVFQTRDDSDFRISIDMEKLGRDMVAKCAGLPLAIIVLGGLLATKETLHDWHMVHRNITSYLRRVKDHEQHSTISEVLALSYRELPFQLKPCFLYLSNFPVGIDIPTKKLVRLWVAEGIVSPAQFELVGEETMEDVGEQFLGNLINRSMVQVVARGATGRVKTCRLHDLMRDLCLSKAKEENFLQIVDCCQGNQKVGLVSSSMAAEASSTSKIRRLAISLDYNVTEFIPSGHKKNPHIRTLLYIHVTTRRVYNWHLLKPLFTSFKLLRVLDLEGIKGDLGELPEGIGSLILLRFLSLRKTRIRELPSSLGNLVCLQTLDLRTVNKVSWESTVQIPNVLWKMERLRHLYLPKWCGNITGELKLANLSNLQTLVNFPASKCDVSFLLRLTNLRKLVLNDPRHFEKFAEIFESPNNRLDYLQSLSLKTDFISFPENVVDLEKVVSGCPSLYKLHVEGRIQMLPEQLPQNLTKLTLWGSGLVEDPMAILQKLPRLSILNGWEMFVGKRMVCSEKGFPQLTSLQLQGMPNLEEWRVEKGAMPRLSLLGISDCNKLKMVPDGLRFVGTLQKLEIRWMPRAFKKRLDRDGEDFIKVEHVPSITFLN